MAEQVPLLEQYERIKAQHKNDILFFRLGDFYEMFFQDALEASSLLNLTLTHRQDAPMCGVPYHAARGYIGRLLKAGKRVAICEQLAPPGKGKGVIERAVVEVVSPGTATDEEFLDARSDNYLAAFGLFDGTCGLAWADASTGEFRAASFEFGDGERLRRELFRLGPKELIIRQSCMDDPLVSQMLDEHGVPLVNQVPDWSFGISQGRTALLAHFGTATMKGYGFQDDDPALAAAGAVLDYLRDVARIRLHHFESLKPVGDGDHAAIDEASQKNLEIDRNLRDGGRAFTLLDTVDETRTAMGARALRKRLLEPLLSVAAIEKRLDQVDSLYRDQRSLEKVRRHLSACLDLERLAARLAMDRAGPRDLLAMAATLDAAVRVEDAVPESGRELLTVFASAAERERARAFMDTVRSAIASEPSAAISEGGVINDGWNAELDGLRALKSDAHGVLAAYLEDERAATGITGLRVKYNRVIGYYLELSKKDAPKVPSHFIRRQSVINAERYSTERLSALESDINGAQERIAELEQRLFADVRSLLRNDAGLLADAAAALSDVDCASSLAWTATTKNYVRPLVDDSDVLAVDGGRHPVVEAHAPSGDFVPNDVSLNEDGVSFALITGPNMAGKSTFLRQNALIVLLAQAGSFVPASRARVGVADRIFCRVGAQDNLARGESTFLLEMHETASILNNAGRKSLVIMDEVGRGTGTLDGLSIAWAVSEHILDNIQCRALFATHYHELTALRHPKLRDLSMSVEEREGSVVFKRRVVPGPAAGSFGIHVAGLAGLPKSVLARAQAIKTELEAQEKRLPEYGAPAPSRVPDSGSLFSVEDMVLGELRSMDLNKMTPLEAMNRLAALKAGLSAKKGA